MEWIWNGMEFWSDILNEDILNDFFLLLRFPFLMFSLFVYTSLLLRWMNR